VFFESSFDFWQELVIFLASGVIVLAVAAVGWIRWALK
jgi:hypothetical protein